MPKNFGLADQRRSLRWVGILSGRHNSNNTLVSWPWLSGFWGASYS